MSAKHSAGLRYCAFGLLILCVVALSPATASALSTPEELYFFPGSLIPGEYGPTWLSGWPATGAYVKTSKFSLTIDAAMLVGWRYRDGQGLSSPRGFRFPAESELSLFSEAYMLVGGIVGEDTLVTSGGNGNDWGVEALPVIDPVSRRAMLPIEAGAGRAYRSVSVDTLYNGNFTFGGFSWDPVRQSRHQPLGIEIITKKYLLDEGVYGNILLVDYIVTNVTDQVIREAWLGIDLHPDVGFKDVDGFYFGDYDDLVGSFRELGSIYWMDNDGDPVQGAFRRPSSLVDGGGMAPTRIYPPMPDTNFNWYVWEWPYPEHDFAPRSRGNNVEPFRPFHSGMVGRPDADVDRYYFLSHREWDYDQIFAGVVNRNSYAWKPVDIEQADEVARGARVRAMQSVGPVTILPDSSIRATFAFFGADFVHVDPYNGGNLTGGKPDQYFDNLHFDIYRKRIHQANQMMQRVLGPQSPPTGLEVSYLSDDTGRLKWDPHVFPEVTGYRIRLSAVPDTCFVGPGHIKPGSGPGPTELLYDVLVPARSLEITDMEPGKYLYATISNLSESGEGSLSPAIVIGYGNKALLPERVEPHISYAFFEDNGKGALASWEALDDTLVAYYKIYRTTDSLTALQRQAPFFAIDTSLSKIPRWAEPKTCGTVSGAPWCYYEMTAYDSVPAVQSAYVDRKAADSALYWVTAVNRFGYESQPSKLIPSQRSKPATQDVLVILGSTSSVHDYVIKDSLVAYYNRLLDGYDYALYHWEDSNFNVRGADPDIVVKWSDLDRYKLIIVEEFPAPLVFKRHVESTFGTLEKVTASGRDLMYFGVPPGPQALSLNTDAPVIRYGDGSPEQRLVGLDSALMWSWKRYNVFGAHDSLAGFSHALPEADDLPSLRVDSPRGRTKDLFRQLFDFEDHLPLTPAFIAGDSVEVLYRYGSAFPETSLLKDLPVGILCRKPTSHVYSFSFHLWAMDPTGARRLIDYVLANPSPDTAFSPALLPDDFALHQNYPNPFNPGTVISFDIGSATKVTLEIFNTLGQKVRTLVDSYRGPGFYRVEWNGRNSNGQTVASGIYLYRLRTDSGTDSKKMVLMR